MAGGRWGLVGRQLGWWVEFCRREVGLGRREVGLVGREGSEPSLESVNGAPVCGRDVVLGRREVGFGVEVGRVVQGGGLSGWVASGVSLTKLR